MNNTRPTNSCSIVIHHRFFLANECHSTYFQLNDNRRKDELKLIRDNSFLFYFHSSIMSKYLDRSKCELYLHLGRVHLMHFNEYHLASLNVDY